MRAAKVFARSGESTQSQPAVAATNNKEQLHLRRLQAVEGATVLRGDLVAETRKVTYSSDGDTGETRNVLTVDIPTGKATWLFPTHSQMIETNYSLVPDDQKRIVTARRSTVVAEHVTTLDSASLVNGTATIVCQRGGRYVVITADPLALTKLTEREIAIPQL